jgi:hypothetical protein
MLPPLEALLIRAADEPDAQERHLDAAFALAAREGGWLTVLCGLRAGQVSPARLGLALEGALAEGRAQVDVRCFCEVARAEVEVRADVAAAARALQAGEGRLADRGEALLLLARAWADALADVEGAQRCLRRAAELARGPVEVAQVAVVFVQVLGDKAAAAELIAVHLPPVDARAMRALGDALRALGRSEEALDLLTAQREQLEARRGPYTDALTLARAAHAWEAETPTRLALALAERLAETPDALLDVAEVSLELRASATIVRSALAEAERRAVTGRRGQPKEMEEGVRRRLVPLLVRSGDDEALQRYARAGLRPAERAPLRRALRGFEPDPAGLFDHLRARLTDAQLYDIACADYGMEAGHHLALLRQITTTGLLPPVLRWNPGEVLRLRRWSEGEGTDHAQRAFCAAVLLLCSEQDRAANEVPILIDSALRLGAPCPALTEGLLAWRCCTLQDWENDDHVCLLWGLALLVAARDPTDPRLRTLADALAVVARAEVEAWEDPQTLEHALRYGQRRALWNVLIDRLLVANLTPAVREILALR